VSDTQAAPRGLRFDGTINLGHVLTIAVILFTGLGTFYQDRGADRGKIEATQRDVVQLQKTVEAQAADTRASLRESVGRVETAVSGLQTQVGIITTLAERVRQLEESTKRLEARDGEFQRYLDERRTIIDQRFSALDQARVESIGDRRELRAAIDQILRASAVNLPGAPGVRHR
jgi:chromosome segregation ATPase